MRRSTRLQIRQQQSVVRLASVPEHENEDGEVAEFNSIAEQQQQQEQLQRSEFSGSVQAQPPPPQLAPLHHVGLPVRLEENPVPSHTLYNFCSNLRPPPLRRWRRQAWINNSRASLPEPPPPPLLYGCEPRFGPPTSAHESDSLSDISDESEEKDETSEEDEDEDEEDDDEEEGARTPVQEQQIGQQTEDAEVVTARPQLRARHGGGGIGPQRSFSQPSIFTFRPVHMSPDIPMTAMRPIPARAQPQLHAVCLPPPSYTTAVAQQQQLATVNSTENGENSQDTTQQDEMDTATTSTSTFNGQVGSLSSSQSSSSRSSRLIQLRQQVEATCSTLYGRGENPSGTSIQDDLASRHSLLVQILNAGRRRSLEEQFEGMETATGGTEDQSSAESIFEDEQIDEQQ